MENLIKRKSYSDKINSRSKINWMKSEEEESLFIFE
jgi:hypothetical protein